MHNNNHGSKHFYASLEGSGPRALGANVVRERKTIIVPLRGEQPSGSCVLNVWVPYGLRFKFLRSYFSLRGEEPSGFYRELIHY